MTISVMVDLETWGLTPGSDIRSIGAVVFDPVAGTLGDTFYVATENPAGRWCQAEFRPDLAKGINDRRYPLTRDPETVKWWGDQSVEAQAAFADPVDLGVALTQFTDFMIGLVSDDRHSIALADFNDGLLDMSSVTFWANGPHFDEQILAACYRAVDLPIPWSYRAPRDCRTIWEAAGWPDIPFEGTPHNALDDAKHQALKVIEAYRVLRNPPTHRYWMAGEADCPRDIKAGNGELHTLRCKVCGVDDPRGDACKLSAGVFS